MEGTFATAITCMDGRVQEPVISWLKEHAGVDYVDMITEAGPKKVLLQNPSAMESIKQKVGISVNVHQSKLLAIISHYDCAGNPLSKEEHLVQKQECIDMVSKWGFPVRIIGLWVDENWTVEKVYDSEE